MKKTVWVIWAVPLIWWNIFNGVMAQDRIGYDASYSSRLTQHIQTLSKQHPKYALDTLIYVDASPKQTLSLIHNGQVLHSWPISTGEKGLGNQSGSNKTPLGLHRVAKKIGKNAQLGMIFKARQATGRVATILTEPGARSKADNVTTRILWLSGLEKGYNQGKGVDSFKRYIYIHGTDEEGRIGAPASHGCIRMKNHDVIDLFQQVPKDTLVYISGQSI